jgi:N-acetylneuraminic acid mutarotase
MGKRIIGFKTIILLLVFISCKKDDKYNFPLIFLGEVTNINSSGATFNLQLTDLGKSKIIDFGFVWNHSSIPSLGNAEQYSIQSTPEVKTYSVPITTTLISGTKYYIRAFIKNSEGIVYSKELSFTALGSLAPKINDFYPLTGYFGDTVIINGSNFSYILSNNTVVFDNCQAQVIYSNQDTLKILVPSALNKTHSKISVEIAGHVCSAVNEFTLIISPVIKDFLPKIAITGSQITITGEHFCPDPQYNNVTIGGVKAFVTSASNKELTVTIPLQDVAIYDSREAIVAVEISNINQTFQSKLLINDKWFRLKNFPGSVHRTNCFTANNKIYVGLHGPTDFWEYDPINNTWTRLSDFPGASRVYGIGFAIDNKIYFGTGYSDLNLLEDWWEYDILSNSWSQKNNFIGGARAEAIAFQIQNEGYLGLGAVTDIWKYNQAADTWTKVTDYPETTSGGIYRAIAIANSQEVYIGLGNSWLDKEYQMMHKYIPGNNSWQRIADFTYSDNYLPNARGFYINCKIYVTTSNLTDFYSYDNSNNLWIKVPTEIFSNTDEGIACSLGDKAYIGLGQTNALWEFDPSR